jgi:hypothetical protein
MKESEGGEKFRGAEGVGGKVDEAQPYRMYGRRYD